MIGADQWPCFVAVSGVTVGLKRGGRALGKEHRDDTISEYDRPRRLHNVVRSSYMKVEGTLIFDKVGTGTRLRWKWDMALIGPMRVLSPVLVLIGPRWERRNWVGLQRYMESGVCGHH